jgi:hypothetical protein
MRNGSGLCTNLSAYHPGAGIERLTNLAVAECVKKGKIFVGVRATTDVIFTVPQLLLMTDTAEALQTSLWEVDARAPRSAIYHTADTRHKVKLRKQQVMSTGTACHLSPQHPSPLETADPSRAPTTRNHLRLTVNALTLSLKRRRF